MKILDCGLGLFPALRMFGVVEDEPAATPQESVSTEGLQPAEQVELGIAPNPVAGEQAPLVEQAPPVEGEPAPAAVQDVSNVPLENTTTPGAELTKVDVPNEHVSLIQRAVELLRNAESDIVDNVEAGITYLETLWTKRKNGEQ